MICEVVSRKINAQSTERGGGCQYDKTCPLSFCYNVDFMMIPPMFIMLQIYFITIKQFIKPPDISKFTYEKVGDTMLNCVHQDPCHAGAWLDP